MYTKRETFNTIFILLFIVFLLFLTNNSFIIESFQNMLNKHTIFINILLLVIFVVNFELLARSITYQYKSLIDCDLTNFEKYSYTNTLFIKFIMFNIMYLFVLIVFITSDMATILLNKILIFGFAPIYYLILLFMYKIQKN